MGELTGALALPSSVREQALERAVVAKARIRCRLVAQSPGGRPEHGWLVRIPVDREDRVDGVAKGPRLAAGDHEAGQLPVEAPRPRDGAGGGAEVQAEPQRPDGCDLTATVGLEHGQARRGLFDDLDLCGFGLGGSVGQEVLVLAGDLCVEVVPVHRGREEVQDRLHEALPPGHASTHTRTVGSCSSMGPPGASTSTRTGGFRGWT